MKDFMIHVERIVRPIRAMDGHKDRMRQELLAHLEASFEQERTKLNDDALAARRAIAGLGDPDQLRIEMQDSVSQLELLKARIEKIFGWRAPEPAWRYTLRSGAAVCAVFLVLVPVVLLCFLPFDFQVSLFVLRQMLFMGLLTGANVFVLGWLYFKMRDNLHQAFGIKRSWLRLLAYLLASAAMVEASLLLFLWAGTGEFAAHLPLLLGRSLVALPLPIAGLLVAWICGPDQLRHTYWECLDIRENRTSPAIAE
jgi:hypothetical protein